MASEDANPETAAIAATAAPAVELPTVLILLLKGVLYREDDERVWGVLLNLQPAVRDYTSVLGLELIIDEAEGYAFLKSRSDANDDAQAPKVPRLVARRPLSYPVSLLLALLRKKLAEFDAGAGQEGEGRRLVLSRDDIVEMVRVFLPENSNDARLIDQIEMHINRVIDLGFLRRLKGTGGPAVFEVRRILKAFIDAQWLTEFDARLTDYQAQLATSAGAGKQRDE